MNQYIGYENGRYRRTTSENNGNSVGEPNSPNTGTSHTITDGNANTTENTGKDSGIRAGEIIAYRCWFLPDKNVLMSTAWLHVWHPGPRRAVLSTIIYGDGGFYSFKKKKEVPEHFWGLSRENPIVYGSIKIWGNIIEHTRGYRSEYASINSIDYIDWGGRYIFKPFKRWKILKELRAKYEPKKQNTPPRVE